ncbi:MAG: TolC family protein [Pirellulaceae bacterium]
MSVGTMAGLMAGCAHPPSQPIHHTTTHAHFHQVAAQVTDWPTNARPIEPEFQGARPVEFYVGQAVERNPQIMASYQAVAAQVEVIPQVTALDDPMLTNTIWPIAERSPQSLMGRMPYGLMASQQLPWFGKLRVKGEAAQQEVRMAVARLAQAELKVIEEVHLAYYELYFNQRAIDVTLENRQLLEDLLQIAEARYRTGDTSQQDIIRAQVEVDRVDQRLITLRQALDQGQADLAQLLHIHPDSKPEALTELAPSSVPSEIERLYDLATGCRPELQEQMAAIVREQRSVELARLDYYPDVNVGLMWDVMTTDQAMAPNADGMDNLGFTIGMNIPLWRNRLQAGVNEAEQRVAQSARQYDATLDETFRQIRRRMVQARSQEEQIRLYRENIIPRSEQTLEISIADYRVGRVSFLQLLDNWMQLLTLEVQLARLEADLRQTLASLERSVGCATAEEIIPNEQTAEELRATRLQPSRSLDSTF